MVSLWFPYGFAMFSPLPDLSDIAWRLAKGQVQNRRPLLALAASANGRRETSKASRRAD